MRFLGTDIQPGQFLVMAGALALLALLYRSGLFEYLGLNALQIVALAVPVVVIAAALASVKTRGDYLYLLVAHRLRAGSGPHKPPNTAARERGKRAR